MTRSRRVAHVAVALGALLALGAPAAWLLADRPATFGGQRAEALREPPAPSPVALPAPAPVPAPSVGTRSARLADVLPPPDPPVSVRIGAQLVPIDPVGLDSRGQVVVPDDVRRAGWFAAGPEPGDDSGSAVVVGHVDDRAQGLGSFAVLRGLQARAAVSVTTSSGAVLTYEVVAVEQFDKREVPVDRVFDSGGRPRLTLVSCGGPFDRTAGRYRDNVVVTAVPVP